MRWRTIALAILGVGVPIGSAVALRQEVEDNPILSAVLLGAYGFVLLLASSAVKIYKELEGRWIRRVSDSIDDWIMRKISSFERRYKEYLHAVNRDVDVKGLPTVGMFSLGIADVYIDLSLVPTPPHDATSDPLGGGESINYEHSASAPSSIGRHDIWYYLGALHGFREHLAVIGPPGAGKTTLLKHVALELAQSRRKTRTKVYLPFLLLLREHVTTIVSNPEISLADIIRASLDASVIRHEPKGWIERRLEKGACLLLFDGLDEVGRPSDRAAVVAWVEGQMATFSRNSFIVTSRPHGYRDNPIRGAMVLRIRPFSEAQMGRFLQSWYRIIGIMSTGGRDDIGVRRTAEEGASELMTKLRENDSLYELAVNPLLLTMIAHVHYYRGALPGRRVELYREVCQVFLGRRQEAKGLKSDLSTDQKEAVLQTAAFQLTTAHERDFDETRAAEILGSALSDVGSDASLATSFVKYIEASSGLLIEREAGQYAFAHSTIQEYLTAAYLKEISNPSLLIENLSDEWWREVFILYAAQSDATPIIDACLLSSSVYALVLAEECAELARGLRPDVRRKLESRLGSPVGTGHGPFGKIALARKLRRATRIAPDTHICREPVTVLDFKLFLENMGSKAVYYQPPKWKTVRHEYGDATAPVVGVSFEAASAFANWVQAEVLPEWIFRLPSQRDPLSGHRTAARTVMSAVNCWTMEASLLGEGQNVGRDELMDALGGACIDTVYWHSPEVLARVPLGDQLPEARIDASAPWSSLNLEPIVELAREIGRRYESFGHRTDFLARKLGSSSEREEVGSFLDVVEKVPATDVVRPLSQVLDLLDMIDRLLRREMVGRGEVWRHVAEHCSYAATRIGMVLGVLPWSREFGVEAPHDNPAKRAEKMAMVMRETCTLISSSLIELDGTARRFGWWAGPDPRPRGLVEDFEEAMSTHTPYADSSAVQFAYTRLVQCLVPSVLRYGQEKGLLAPFAGIILVRSSGSRRL